MNSSRPRNIGFSIVEVLVVTAVCILIIAVGVVVMLPTMNMGTRSGGSRQMQNHTQVRGIHQAMVTYAQSNNNNFPGMDSQGNVTGTVEDVYLALLQGNFFTGDYIIATTDTNKVPWTGGPVTSANYSYAMLDFSDPQTQRAAEWSDTINTQAPILSDRNLGTNATTDVQSIWTTNPGDWRGSVAWNDNHTTFEVSHETGITTQYGTAGVNTDDNLFTTNASNNNGGDDAYMIYRTGVASNGGSPTAPR